MIETYKEEYESIIEKKAIRLREVKSAFELSDVDFTYRCQDVVEFVKYVPKDFLFVSFPPFYVGGYEKQYAFLDRTVETPELDCEYKMFDDTSLVSMVDTLVERGVSFIIGTNRGELFKDNKGVKIVSYDYFSGSEMVYFVTDIELGSQIAEINIKETVPYKVDLVTKEDVYNFDENTKIEVKEIPLDLVDSIRKTRISGHIKKPTAPMTKFGCFADGKLFGVFGIDAVSIKYKDDNFYLLSDLPVKNVNKVAKLVAALATSEEEFRKILKEATVVKEIPVSDLQLLEKNANVMEYAVLERLSENIKHDGILKQLPVVQKLPNGKYEVISGNHRVKAAKEAGLDKIYCLACEVTLPDDEKLRLQISHNTIGDGRTNSYWVNCYRKL
jgi:uncharacterized ParB-like nuclease family protein